MAQTTRSRSKGATGRNGSRSRSSSSKESTVSKRSSSGARRTSSNASRARKGPSASRPRSKSRSSAQSQNGAEAIRNTAIDKTKTVGQALAGTAAKAKTPLIAGGAALAGAAAAAVIKDRLDAGHSKSPLKRLRGGSVTNPAARLDLGKLDFATVKAAAERVSAYGQQAADIAAAVEKTRKKNG